MVVVLVAECIPYDPKDIRDDTDFEVDQMDKDLASDYGEGVEDEIQADIDNGDNKWVRGKDGIWRMNDKWESEDPE